MDFTIRVLSLQHPAVVRCLPINAAIKDNARAAAINSTKTRRRQPASIDSTPLWRALVKIITTGLN